MCSFFYIFKTFRCIFWVQVQLNIAFFSARPMVASESEKSSILPPEVTIIYLRTKHHTSRWNILRNICKCKLFYKIFRQCCRSNVTVTVTDTSACFHFVCRKLRILAGRYLLRSDNENSVFTVWSSCYCSVNNPILFLRILAQFLRFPLFCLKKWVFLSTSCKSGNLKNGTIFLFSDTNSFFSNESTTQEVKIQ